MYVRVHVVDKQLFVCIGSGMTMRCSYFPCPVDRTSHTTPHGRLRRATFFLVSPVLSFSLQEHGPDVTAEVIQEWEAGGGEAWQLIEPVDGFHPNQVRSHSSVVSRSAARRQHREYDQLFDFVHRERDVRAVLGADGVCSCNLLLSRDVDPHVLGRWRMFSLRSGCGTNSKRIIHTSCHRSIPSTIRSERCSVIRAAISVLLVWGS